MGGEESGGIVYSRNNTGRDYYDVENIKEQIKNENDIVKSYFEKENREKMNYLISMAFPHITGLSNVKKGVILSLLSAHSNFHRNSDSSFDSMSKNPNGIR